MFPDGKTLSQDAFLGQLMQNQAGHPISVRRCELWPNYHQLAHIATSRYPRAERNLVLACDKMLFPLIVAENFRSGG